MVSRYFKLFRVEQWYKNLIIFLPLVFAPQEAVQAWPKLILAFVGFCSISSLGYIMNDWKDRKADALHPTKKFRPLASGAISGKNAVLAGIFLIFVTMACILILGIWYASLIIAYFILTSAYTHALKQIPVLDIALISANFIIRGLAGLRGAPDSSLYVYFALIFFVIFILLTHKRRSDIKFLDSKAALHKPVLRFYTPFVSYLLRIIGYAGLAYCLYLLTTNNVLSVVKGIAFAGFFMLTSILMSADPLLAMKPQKLFKIWYWNLTAVVFVFLFLLS